MSAQGIRRVLVAIKPWQRGVPIAAAHARALAQGSRGALRLVSCVFDSQVAVELERNEASAFAAQAGMIDCERIELERLSQTLHDWGVPVDNRVLWEAPAYEGVLRAAREWPADLLVVGTHEVHPGLHTRLIDMDWQLMRRCPCPLLLVKDPHFNGYSTILAAIDPLHSHAEPSGMDQAVLGVARQFSKIFESELRVAHAFPDPETFALASAIEVAPGVLYGAENIEAVHRRAVVELVSGFGVLPAEIDLAPGQPAETLTRLARERHAELLVLGAVRRSQLEQAMLGSTAEAVAAEAECDVLFVPPPPLAQA
jgi:universal stress protein E